MRKTDLLFRTQDVHCITNPKVFWIFQWYLGKGNSLRVSRCIPSGNVSFRALNPARDKRTFSRSITNRVSIPATPDTPIRTSSRPFHGDDFIESKGRSCPCTILTRKGAVALPFLGTIPSTKGVSRPWSPDQPYADWMPPPCQSWTMIKGRSDVPRNSLCRGVDIS